MKKLLPAVAVCLIAFSSFIGSASPAVAEDDAVEMLPAMSGKVVETMDAGSYTYVQVDTGEAKIWAAGPKFKVAVGDTVTVPEGMAMRNFSSKSLNRTFDVISFADQITVAGGKAPASGAVAAHAAIDDAGKAHTGAPRVDASGVSRAPGGQTVAEIYADRSKLAGKEVTVRGKVAKYMAGVMGKNWLHLQDGSGSPGSNDITVTTDGTTAVGKTVVAKGKLATDKDFGAGYKYDVIIEDASLSEE